MSSLTVVLLALAWFAAGYFIYGRIIEKRLIKPDDSRTTPSHEKEDGVDYAPAGRFILWGDHFASIAGAGPIIGPIMAVSIFGWGPTLFWVALGSVFLGAVHDYVALMISVRHGGAGIAELAKTLLGPQVRLALAALLYLVLVLLIAVFMVSVAQAMVNMPALVIPTLGLIAIALGLGLVLQRRLLHPFVASFIAVVLAYALIWVGAAIPVPLPASWGIPFWVMVLALYCLWASVAPVWRLLRPRDFISSVKLVVGMVLGFIGLLTVQPVINAPFSLGLMPQDKPVWPMLFILVACGAISGFHALVSTGTTARQLNKESQGRFIAFGGMITEGVLALLVIMLVSAGLKWGMAPEGTPKAALDLYFGNALHQNWIIAFGSGFGQVVGQMEIPLLTSGVAALLGAVMVKAFILTTLDTGTRLARFVVSDSLGSGVAVLQNRVVATVLVLIPATILALTSAYSNVWKLFGAANQLIAALTLLVATVYMASLRLPRRYTLWPAYFMLATTLCALLWETFAPSTGYFTKTEPDVTLGVLALILAGLGALVLVKGLGRLHEAPDTGAGLDAGPGKEAKHKLRV